MHPIHTLRHIGLLEGASFLVLLFVAMPLKYLAHAPIAVKVVGWGHGVLFMLVVAALVRAMIVAKWPVGRGLLVLAAALVPFGPFAIDARLKRWAGEYDGRAIRA
jgi:integral membrane protein